MSYQRPDKDSYFLDIAKAVSARSTCLRRRYGAVIVDSAGTICSTGYNGAARGEMNCVDKGICPRIEKNIAPGTMYEECEAVHAEANAIIAASPERARGATIYIAGYNVADESPADGKPCKMCARMIKNAQIARVVY